MKLSNFHVAFLLCFACLLPSHLAAQEKPPAQPASAAAASAANPKDVESIDAIMAALYNVISGPAGERNWDRFRSLFLPEARMGAVHKNPDGTFVARTFTPQGYVERAGGYFKEHAFF